jgi:hypothetical protein
MPTGPTHVHPLTGRRGRGYTRRLRGGLLLCDDFSGVELDEHCAVRLEFFNGNAEAKVVQHQELEFEVVEFYLRETTDLFQ